MADNNNYRITARVNGKEQKTFNFGEKTLRIDAAANTVYEIEEVGFSSIPDNIVFSRVGDDLWIMPEGSATPQAILAGYFSTKNASFGAIGVDGALYSYGIETLSEPAIDAAKAASVEHTLAGELTTSAAPTANASETSSSVSLVDNINVPVVSTAALALGGIAIAAGTGGSSHNSANENSQPTEDKSAINSVNDVVNKNVNTTSTDGIIVASGGMRPVEQPIQANENVTTPLGASSYESQDYVIQAQKALSHAGSNYAPELKLSSSTKVEVGSAKAGMVVFQVKASDQDGDFLTYHLTDTGSGSFEIDIRSGAVMLTATGAAKLNSGETLPVAKVVAYDGTEDSKEMALNYADPSQIEVAPIVNHAPIIAATLINPIDHIDQGSAEEGMLVGQLSASDSDGDILSYYLVENPQGAYSVELHTGKVSLTAAGAALVNAGLDLPNIRALAYDGKGASAVSDIDVIETTENVSNHAPTNLVLVEQQDVVIGRAKAGDSVATLSANDQEGDTIHYYLVNNPHNVYALDGVTGRIALTEQGAKWVNDGNLLPKLQVVAYDQQDFSSIVTLDIPQPKDAPVIPENHAPNTPTFSDTAQSFIQGEVEAGTIVTRAKATDPDEDTITYSLGNQDGFFAIDAQSGMVTLTTKGAEYVNQGYSLPDVTVIASDGKLTSQASVDIGETEVTTDPVPVNHAPTAPVFSDVTSQFIQGHTQVGDHVLTAKATDIDNDTIEYRLTSANNNVFFNINAETGQITLSELGAKHVNDGYTLPAVEVVAFDGKITGESASALTGHTETPAVDIPALPTPADPPMPLFSVDTQFHDSRELENVERPYFIQALNVDYPYGYLSNWDGYGHGMTVSYQFADNAHASGQSASGYNSYDFTVGGFREYSLGQQAAIREVLSIYEEYSNLTFEERSASEQANFRFYLDNLNYKDTYRYNNFESRADITVTDNMTQEFASNGICPCCGLSLNALTGQTSESNDFTFVSGYAWFGGDVHLNSTVYTSDHSLSKNTPFFKSGTITYQGGFGALLHEIGHSIGFHHIFAETDAPSKIPQGSAEDESILSIMSYTPIYSSDGHAISATKLGIFDLAALHYRYGVNPNQNSGDDTYTFKSFNQESVGNDIYIWDGAGNDTFDASGETKTLHIDLTPGSWIYRGEKSDTLVFDEHKNIVEDQMFIGFGTQIENLKGGFNHDILIGNETNNHIEGGAGNDQIFGGAGNDWLEGGEGIDLLKGGDGDDILDGGLGADALHGGAGNDIYYVDHANDQIVEESGVDTVYSSISYTLGAGLENLHLYKGAGNINATGNELDNVLWGNEGDNILKGGSGHDELHGGAGNDTLEGGAGADIFFIDGAGLDIIADFNANEGDIIKLDKNVFEQLKTGVFNPEFFVSNDSGIAQDANDHFIYNASNNTLYYDADGNGALGAVAIAKFADDFNDQLNASNFQVY